MKVTIFHNPRCSKSRQTLALLKEEGYSPEIVEYLKNPPTTNELEQILTMLGMEPEQLIRKGEAEYKNLGLDKGNFDRQALIQEMVNTPKLIERPIVIADQKAALGRPPENVLTILK